MTLVKLVAGLHALMLVLVGGLGHDNFHVRTACQAALQRVVDWTAYTWPLEMAQGHPDAEVRVRCRRVLRLHNVRHANDAWVPDFCCMRHFRHLDGELWGLANQLPPRQDTRCYVRLLLLEKGLSLWQVRLEIARACWCALCEHRR